MTQEWPERARDSGSPGCDPPRVLATPSVSETLPVAARALLGASLRLLVRADAAAAQASGARERLRASAALLPLPTARRPYDDL